MTAHNEAARPPPPAPADLLPRYLTIAWVALTVYGSLYPFADWRQGETDPFAYLNLAWPQYWTVFDMIVNVLVYMPLGLYATLMFSRLPGRYTAPLLATLLGVLLSFSLESLQSWLPSRVASNLDLACNSLGALLGSLIALWAGIRLWETGKTWRQRIIAPLPHVDLGLTLLGLWLLTLLSPEILLFGVGDLRQALAWLPTFNDEGETYRHVEAAVVGCNLLAVGLFAGAMTRGRWLAFALTPVFFLVAALIRSLGAALLLGPEYFLAWLTAGAEDGLRIGGMALGVCLLLPPAGRLILAAVALLAGAILVNLAPIDPYSPLALDLWRKGHFLNFNGLTRWVAAIWPFLALPYLFWVSRRL
jgi:VanZ family protein